MKSKQHFITGAIILGVSGVIAKMLGIFFRWPVTLLIGDEGIGLYQLGYPVYMFIISTISGFPIAISRMVSERVALGSRSDAHRVFKLSFTILFLVGAVISILLYLGAPFLIRILRWREGAYYSLVAVAFAPLFVSIMYAYRGYFQGLQMMAMPAVSQVVEQIGRVAVGVGLTYILLPFGVSYGAAGASFGACAGAILGCIILLVGYMKNKKNMLLHGGPRKKEKAISIIRELLSTAIPISMGMTVGAVMSLIDSIVVPSQLLSAGFGEKTATELYGQLAGKAHVLINVPLTISMALGTSLVPAISEVKALRSVSRIKQRAETALKLAILFGLPSAVGLFILADPILHMLFPGMSQGAEVLRILSLSIIFIVVTQTLVSILHGVGNVSSPVKNNIIGAIFKLVFVCVLTPMPVLNIKGAAISSIIGYAVAALLNFKDAVRYTYISFDIDKMLLRPVLASFLMGFSVYLTYNWCAGLTRSNGIATIVSVIIGIIVYMLMIILTGCLSIADIRYYARYKKR